MTVCGANVDADACNGVYHEEDLSMGICPAHTHVYENNSGGIIYYADGQWRLKSQKSFSDYIYSIDSDAAVPPIGKWRHQDGIGCCNIEVSPIPYVM